MRRARAFLGTFVEISLDGASSDAMQAASDAAFTAIERVHRLMSFHDPESDLGRINRSAGDTVTVHPWTYRVLVIAATLARQSAGLFDIAVAPVLQALGLLPHIPDGVCPIAPRHQTSVELQPGYRVRLRDEKARIDLGGIAKGFAVDRATAVLRSHGMPAGLVNAGGDMRAFGPAAQRVLVRHPQAPWQALFEVEIRNEALASSAPCFDLVSGWSTSPPAIVDPRTQMWADANIAAMVRAPTCVLADALTNRS